MVDIVATLSQYRDERYVLGRNMRTDQPGGGFIRLFSSGDRPAASLEGVPEETNIPDLSFDVSERSFIFTAYHL